MYAKPIVRNIPHRLRRSVRFSVRTLVILITLISLLFGWKTHRVRRQRAAIDAVGQHGYVIYRHEYPHPLGATGKIDYQAEPPGPRWCRRLLGDHFFHEVRFVDFRPTDESMAELANLTDVERVTMDASNLTDDALRYLTRLSNLQYLTIRHGPRLTNESFLHIGKLGRLRVMLVDNVPIDSRALVHLNNLRHLKQIELYRTFLNRSDYEMLCTKFPGAFVGVRGDYDSATDYYLFQTRQKNRRVIPTNDEISRQMRLNRH